MHERQEATVRLHDPMSESGSVRFLYRAFVPTISPAALSLDRLLQYPLDPGPRTQDPSQIKEVSSVKTAGIFLIYLCDLETCLDCVTILDIRRDVRRGPKYGRKAGSSRSTTW